MTIVTPWYCKSFTLDQDDYGHLYVYMEFTRPIKWFFRAAEGVKWVWGRVKRAVR